MSSRTSLTLYCATFFFNAPPPTEIYTLSLHDALPISKRRHHHRADRERKSESADDEQRCAKTDGRRERAADQRSDRRSEEHTSELQSRFDLVCRLLLEKKKMPIGISDRPASKAPYTSE